MIFDLLEEMPLSLRKEVERWCQLHGGSLAARYQPRLEKEAIGWSVRHRFESGGQITGTGPTIAAAIASWESNFREATAAEQ